MKARYLLLAMFFSLMSLKSLAADYTVLELLINLHKEMKKAEDNANENIALGTGIQTETEGLSDKYNRVKSTLNSKVNNVYSYVIFASSIYKIVIDLQKLTDEYKDYTLNTYRYCLSKPMILWYYKNCNTAIYKEIKHAKNLLSIYTASGANVWRATMEEKYKLLRTLSVCIMNVRGYISNASYYSRLIVSGLLKQDYIWQILNDETIDRIVHKAIVDWLDMNGKNYDKNDDDTKDAIQD